jgi:hypothetical protein
MYISLERGTAWFSRTVVRLKDETMLRPNQALPEGIPLGQADGMSVGTFSMANGGFTFL